MRKRWLLVSCFFARDASSPALEPEVESATRSASGRRGRNCGCCDVVTARAAGPAHGAYRMPQCESSRSRSGLPTGVVGLQAVVGCIVSSLSLRTSKPNCQLKFGAMARVVPPSFAPLAPGNQDESAIICWRGGVSRVGLALQLEVGPSKFGDRLRPLLMLLLKRRQPLALAASIVRMVGSQRRGLVPPISTVNVATTGRWRQSREAGGTTNPKSNNKAQPKRHQRQATPNCLQDPTPEVVTTT